MSQTCTIPSCAPTASALPVGDHDRAVTGLPLDPMLNDISRRSVVAENTPTLESAVAGELPHIEVETYTWSVLPETAGGGGDTALIRGIAAELRWAAAQLFDGGVR